VLTSRSCFRQAFRCGVYESEDVLAEIDSVDLIELKPGRAFEFRREIQKKLVFHDFTKTMVSRNMAFQPVHLEKEYDLFVVHLPLSQDLIHIPAVKGWKDKCRTSVCWIDEIWSAAIPSLEPWLPALDEFDHVFVGMQGSVDALRRATARDWRYLPIAVDAFRMSPFPHPPERVIDVFSMGRRSVELHRALLDLATNDRIFYVHDTFGSASDIPVADHRQHRSMLANMAKRSRLFVVAPGKVDVPDETKHQIEIGLRYYEAAASGAVMIGQAPAMEPFRSQFDWPDAVVELHPDGSDTAQVIRGLLAQAEVLSKMGRRSAIAALRRHDWVYRWKEILRVAGVEPAEKMEMRERDLRRLAEQGADEDR